MGRIERIAAEEARKREEESVARARRDHFSLLQKGIDTAAKFLIDKEKDGWEGATNFKVLSFGRTIAGWILYERRARDEYEPDDWYLLRDGRVIRGRGREPRNLSDLSEWDLSEVVEALIYTTGDFPRPTPLDDPCYKVGPMSISEILKTDPVVLALRNIDALSVLRDNGEYLECSFGNYWTRDCLILKRGQQTWSKPGPGQEEELWLVSAIPKDWASHIAAAWGAFLPREIPDKTAATSLSPRRRDLDLVTFRCGHENHPSRQVCGVCGAEP